MPTITRTLKWKTFCRVKSSNPSYLGRTTIWQQAGIIDFALTKNEKALAGS
jgi:hypothetical protein